MKNSFWKTISRYTKGHEKKMFIAILFSFVTGIAVAIQPLVIKYIVDDGIMADLAKDDKLRTVAFLCGLYVLVSLLRIAFFGIAYDAANKLMEGTLCNLRNSFFAKVQNLSMSFYDKTASGELFNCIMGSPLNNIKTFLQQCVINIPYQSISFIISLTALFTYDALLTGILLIIAVVMVILNHISRKKVKKIAREYISTENEASKYINDMLHGLEATKIYSENGQSCRFLQNIFL